MKIAAAILMGMVFLSGCAGQRTGTGVEIYTFEQERVDQELDGNRGYLMGTPPEAPRDRKTTRTLIGVDVELPTAREGEEGIGQIEAAKRAQPERGTEVEPVVTEVEEPRRTEPTRQHQPVSEPAEEEWIK